VLASTPKLGRTPASRRRPPPCADFPEPQLAIRVPTPPPVQYRAATPENVNRMPETQDVFQDADEDLRPLASESYVDIVDSEVREGTAVTSSALPVTWAIGAPMVAATISTTTATTVVGVSIPTTVLEIIGESSDSPTVIASTPDASQPESVAASTASAGPTSGPIATVTAPPLLTASVSQTDTRYSDIAYAVRLSQAGQTERVADSLLANFQTGCTREELIFAIRAMTALLRDVGAFFWERIVGERLVDELLQSIHNDLVGALDRFMGDDDHHHPA